MEWLQFRKEILSLQELPRERIDVVEVGLAADFALREVLHQLL